MKNKSSKASLVILLIIALICLFGPTVFGVSAEKQELAIRNHPPTLEHFFGTDMLGRDIFARVCEGGRTSLSVAVICTIVTTLIGCLYGGIAALVNKLEKVMMMCLDILVSIPDILIILTISLCFESRSTFTVCLSICLIGWCKMAKLIRDLLIPMRDSDFVIQSKMIGKSEIYIVLFHMIPNIMPTVISRIILSFSEFMFYESFVSYLGIGLMPPKTSWGNLLSNLQPNFITYPYQAWCCSFLLITLIITNILGESIKNSNDSRSDEKKKLQNDSDNVITREKNKEREIVSRNTNTVLMVKNLSVKYSGTSKSVVDDVSFVMQEDEIVGLIGQSGCGKTTIARALSGSLSFYGGIVSAESFVSVCGKIVDFNSEQGISEILGKEGVAIVYQNPMAVLDPSMKIGKQLFECIKIGGIKNKLEIYNEAIKFLTEVAIDNPEQCLNKYPYQLSGGMAQRIVIAMALVMHPKLIICDEPTASLDTVNQKYIIQLIKKVANEHKIAVLFISHDMNVVKAIATRNVYMENGKLIELDKNELPKKQLPEKKTFVDYHTMKTILRVEHLSAGYKNNDYMIHDISFKLKEGETLGILGESGSGKTTIVRALLKSLVVSQLKLFVDASSRVSTEGKLKIQYIFQNPQSSFDPTWSTKDSICEGLGDEDITDILKKVELSTEQIGRLPSELSIGQCQRAAIARAIVNLPDLLICDEPTSAMDVNVQNSILKLIKNLLETKKIPCVFITHDLDVIKCMSDRIIVLYKGRIVEVLNAEIINENSCAVPLHPYTQCLLGLCKNERIYATEGKCVDGCKYYGVCPYKMDICKLKEPQLMKVGMETVEERHHFIACHYYRK